MTATSTTDLPDAHARHTDDQWESPVFIGGLSHSGKTPLRLMLSSLTSVAFTRRTYMWRLFYRHYGDLGRPGNLDRCLAAMMRHGPIAEMAPDVGHIRAQFAAGPSTYARLFALFHQENARRLGKRRWGDQLGMVEQYADPIFAAYPTARMIHMVRDPRTRYGAISRRGRARLGKVGIETARWLDSIRLGEANQRRYPACYRLVRYETLLDQPTETLTALCRFLGEEVDPVGLAGDWLQDERARGNLDTASFGAGWVEAGDAPALQRQLSPGDLLFIEQATRPVLDRFDYAPMPVHVNGRARVHYRCVDWPANRLAMALRPLLNSI